MKLHHRKLGKQNRIKTLTQNADMDPSPSWPAPSTSVYCEGRAAETLIALCRPEALCKSVWPAFVCKDSNCLSQFASNKIDTQGKLEQPHWYNLTEKTTNWLQERLKIQQKTKSQTPGFLLKSCELHGKSWKWLSDASGPLSINSSWLLSVSCVDCVS